MSGLRQADAVGSHLAPKEPLSALSQDCVKRSRGVLAGAGAGERHLCFGMPAAQGSESRCRAAHVRAPQCRPTALCSGGIVQRKRACEGGNLPQTATLAGNHLRNGLIETSNGKRVS